MVMVQLETDEQWNFLKFVMVVKVFNKVLRQTFKRMWNKKYGHQWDDSKAVRKLLYNKEAGKDKGIKLLTNKSYEEWDTTALCKFTLYAKSFATRDSKGDLKTLNELYIKPRGPNPSGQFHTSVISANGNIDETYALAIDQLRLLRNWCSHSTRAEMDKKTFDRFVKLAKDAFKALSVNTDDIDAIVSATGSTHSEARSCDMLLFFFPPISSIKSGFSNRTHPECV